MLYLSNYLCTIHNGHLLRQPYLSARAAPQRERARQRDRLVVPHGGEELIRSGEAPERGVKRRGVNGRKGFVLFIYIYIYIHTYIYI